MSSVLAAVALTGLKLVVGALTGSLGILAEAAHSGLDLIAALMTYLAVRFAGKPADHRHHYGHGKIENLSALFETLLLLGTCVWIAYEAIHRLVAHSGAVEVTFWSFAVMALSMVVDISRSRMLYRAARKYNSQALEADALHFSTDIWSSAVVIVGLGCTAAARRLPAFSFLDHADAVAALGVAAIVVFISARMGARTLYALLDTAPEGVEERIVAAAERVDGVIDCHHVRVRYSGAQLFVDLHVTVSGSLTLAAAHSLTESIESAILEVAPGADITVHPEPQPINGGGAGET